MENENGETIRSYRYIAYYNKSTSEIPYLSSAGMSYEFNLSIFGAFRVCFYPASKTVRNVSSVASGRPSRYQIAAQ